MTGIKSWEDFLAAHSVGLFLLLDGAAIPSLPAALYRLEDDPAYLPLYLQTEFAALMDVSPYLIQVTPPSPLLDTFRTTPDFASAGILFASPERLPDLKNRLTDILTVLTPSYNEMLFRFYDPAVLDLLIRAGETSLLDAVRGPARCVAWCSSTKDRAGDRLTLYPAGGVDHADV